MDNQMIGAQQNTCGKWHWLHRLAGWKAMILSFLSGIALILAWIATFRGTVFGLIAPHYYWDALILGVLALCAKVIWAECE